MKTCNPFKATDFRDFFLVVMENGNDLMFKLVESGLFFVVLLCRGTLAGYEESLPRSGKANI